MVYFGGHISKTYPLDLPMNGICLAIGAGELLWGIVVKLFPKEIFGCMKFDERPMTEEEEGKSMMAIAKKGTTRVARKSKMQESMEKALSKKVSDSYSKMK